MRQWPKGVEACSRCTGSADRYAHGSGRYCSRCYRLLRRIKRAEGWNQARRETLVGIAKSGMYPAGQPDSPLRGLETDPFSEEQFQKYRRSEIRQCEERLDNLRLREAIRRHQIPVEDLDLENKFRELLRLIRPKARYPDNANCFNRYFNQEQKRVLYALLEEVIEQAPPRPIFASPY
jgi:hypothetical protein